MKKIITHKWFAENVCGWHWYLGMECAFGKNQSRECKEEKCPNEVWKMLTPAKTTDK